jgi:hypothetical protein
MSGPASAQPGSGFRCDFGLGSGSNELQTVGGVGESARFREYSTILLEDDLLVFDPLSQRILRRAFDSSGCKGPVTAIPLATRGGAILRLAALRNELYGLTASGKIRLVARYFKGEPLRLVVPGQESGGAVESEVVLAHFAEQLPVLPNTSATFDPSGPVAAPKGNEAGYISSLVRSYSAGLSAAADGSIFRYRLNLCSSSMGRLDVWRDDDPQKIKSTLISVPEGSWLGVVSIIGAKSLAEFRAMYQAMAMDGNGTLKTSLNVIDESASGSRLYVANFRDGQAVSSPDMAQVAMQPSERKVVIVSYLISISGSGPKKERLRIAAIPLRASTQAATGAARASCESGAASWVPPNAVSSNLNREQQEVLKRARAFIDATWCSKQENLRVGVTCEPPFDRPGNSWKQPFTASFVQPGERVRGVYYLWGGKDPVEKILARYGEACESQSSPSSKRAPAIAGNVCTEVVDGRPAWHPDAAGIDCSGFVSRAWSISSTPGTAQMHENPSKYGLSVGPSIESSMVADALLYRTKSSGHVRLFGGWVVTPLGVRTRVYESTTESICSGTCERDLDFLQIAGYRFMGLNKLRMRESK